MITSVALALLAMSPTSVVPFSVRDLKGKTWNAESFLIGRPVLIEFWATWCGTCREMQPAIKKLAAARVPGSWDFVTVSIDTDLTALRKYFKTDKPQWPVLLDTNGKMSDSWKVAQVPSFFLVKNGKVERKWVGKVPISEIEAALRDLR